MEQGDVESSVEILRRIQEDESIPKNIRAAAEEAEEILTDGSRDR